MSSHLHSTFIVLCGKTGSGKTLLLQQLESSGYPILNLEKIASHRGSSFGDFLLSSQPSQKDFETSIKDALGYYVNASYIFIEQKASSVGKRKIPLWLYDKMEEGIFVQLDVDVKQRIQNILCVYQEAGKEKFMKALHKLKDRLSISKINQCETFIREENYAAFVEAMLDYYDNSAKYNLIKEPDIIIVPQTNEPLYIMYQLLQAVKQKAITIS